MGGGGGGGGWWVAHPHTYHIGTPSHIPHIHVGTPSHMLLGQYTLTA